MNSESFLADYLPKYHKDTFDKISDKKKQRILDAAIDEFASKGFSSANINVIAHNAEISIGSMYNYFASKQDLFLTIMNYGYAILDIALKEVDFEKGDIFDKIEKMLRAAQSYARKYTKLNQIYLDATSEGLSHLSKKLSKKMESISSKYYKDLLEQAKKDGIVDKSLNSSITSYCLDNIILLFQFSYTTKYYNERMKIFAGEEMLDNDEDIINGIMHFIRNAISN